MSKHRRYGAFRKKDFLRMANNTITYLCDEFGYRLKPRLIETRLEPCVIMMYSHDNKPGVIYCNYKEFKRLFGDLEYNIQEAIVSGIVAHEVRHYYQHRQIWAKNPREREEIVERWRQCEENCVDIRDKMDDEYVLNGLELDAYLFEYLFIAHIFDMVLISLLRDEIHLNALEKLYIEYYGKTNEKLFGQNVRKTLQMRKS